MFTRSTFPNLLCRVLFVLAFATGAANAGQLNKTTHIYRPELAATSPALDIYTRPGLADAPVMIYVHGGAWTIGNKRSVHSKHHHFLELGYVFVSVDYRLVPKVNVAEQLADIDAALGWIAANISSFGGDANNLHLMGHSAGAHLVSMTAIAPLAMTRGLIDRGAIRSVITNDTRAYDLVRIPTVSRGGEMPRLYANVFGRDPNIWAQYSPIHRLNANRPIPPFLILYSGQGDEAVRAAFARDFATALAGSGTQAVVFDGRSYSHSQINKKIGTAPDITSAIDAFLADKS